MTHQKARCAKARPWLLLALISCAAARQWYRFPRGHLINQTPGQAGLHPVHARAAPARKSLSHAVRRWPPTLQSAHFPYDCDAHASNTSLLLSVLADEPLPDAHVLPDWILHACPEVARHFASFPYFPAFHRTVPVSTTRFAAAGACTLKVISDVAVQAGLAPPQLHAGSHLGALIHGGPIPWDDDIDILMPWEARDRLLAGCQAARHAIHPTVTLACTVRANAIKVFVRPRRGVGCAGRQAGTATCASHHHIESVTMGGGANYSSPFLDLFLYRRNGSRLFEVQADTGRPRPVSFPFNLTRPLQPYYFAGLRVPGPPPALASFRYKVGVCMSGMHNHRLEERVPAAGRLLLHDCCALARAGFPFVVEGGRALVAGGGGGRRGRAVVDLVRE